MSYGQISVIKRSGEDTGYFCLISSKGVSIGRDLNCDIRVQMARVSRLHCRVKVEKNMVSKNNLQKK